MKLKLDDWQKEVLATKKNLALCSGRQCGKSTVIAIKAGEEAVKNKNYSIMVVAHVERQAMLLFEKILSYLYLNYKTYIKKGKDKPTKARIKLTNGSVIYCLPTGDSGYGIRGYTIDSLYADEAAFIYEDVWSAITPMLATTGGKINLLSTPCGAIGYFYDRFHDPKFHSIHVNAEEVAEKRKEPQRTNMIQHQKDERERMTKLQYQQEYLGLFVGGIMRWFPDDIINQTCILPERKTDLVGVSGLLISSRDYFQGVDIARMGGDETVLTTFERTRAKNLLMIDLDIPEGQTLTETARLIIHKDKQLNHKKIYIDTTGMGWGVFDPLKEDIQTRRKVMAIENVKKSLDREKDKEFDTRKRTFKEDLYNNMRNLMENKKILFFEDARIKQSLRSIQYDIESGSPKIYGNYSHITESMVRAAWCMKDKTLNIMAFC